jgi:hypothetical protein
MRLISATIAFRNVGVAVTLTFDAVAGADCDVDNGADVWLAGWASGCGNVTGTGIEIGPGSTSELADSGAPAATMTASATAAIE